MGKGDARTRGQSALPSRLEDPEGMNRSEKGPAGWAWGFIPALFKPPQIFLKEIDRFVSIKSSVHQKTTKGVE